MQGIYGSCRDYFCSLNRVLDKAHYGNVVQHFKWDTDYGEFVVIIRVKSHGINNETSKSKN